MYSVKRSFSHFFLSLFSLHADIGKFTSLTSFYDNETTVYIQSSYAINKIDYIVSDS